MNIDFKSLEKRYGTLLALKIHEEISRADQKRFAFYQIPPSLKALRQGIFAEDRELETLHKMAG